MGTDVFSNQVHASVATQAFEVTLIQICAIGIPEYSIRMLCYRIAGNFRKLKFL